MEDVDKFNVLSFHTNIGNPELELFKIYLDSNVATPEPIGLEALLSFIDFIKDCISVLTPRTRGRLESITDADKNLFLLSLERCGSIVKSARYCGRSRARLHQIKQTNPEFKERWEEALLMFQANLTEEAHRRAARGVVEPIYQRGELVGKKLSFSDPLMIMMLKQYAGFGNGVSATEERGVVILPGPMPSVSEWEDQFVGEDNQ